MEKYKYKQKHIALYIYLFLESNGESSHNLLLLLLPIHFLKSQSTRKKPGSHTFLLSSYRNTQHTPIYTKGISWKCQTGRTTINTSKHTLYISSFKVFYFRLIRSYIQVLKLLILNTAYMTITLLTMGYLTWDKMDAVNPYINHNILIQKKTWTLLSIYIWRNSNPLINNRHSKNWK